VNDLVERTIDFLERHSVRREIAPTVPDELAKVPDTVFVGTAFFMEKFTYLVEKEILEKSLEAGSLFINFQSFAKILRRARQLREIDALNNRVFAYGADEVGDWPFSRFKRIKLSPDDSLLDSWFIIYASGDATYSLVALQGGPGQVQERSRRFRGFWTRRPSITHYLCDYLLRVVNPQYEADSTP